MRVSRNISIRLKFIILGLVVLGFSIFSGLSFLHSENTLQQYRELEMTFEISFAGLNEIDEKLMQLVYISNMDSISDELPEEFEE